MYGLGIETTCDETSIGIVENGDTLLSLELFSQIELHQPFRGVVPEIASRAHLEKINLLLDRALQTANLSLQDLAYVSVSAYPGLLGALIIGGQMARCLSLALQIPVVAINHLEAHLAAIRLEGHKPPFPFLGLLLSGGNSAIYLVEDFGKMTLIGDTMDDALGEAFDKVATLLQLPYPGGPWIEKKAAEYTPVDGEKSLFPELLKNLPRDQVQFSYSGLKTSVLYYLRKNPPTDADIAKICYHFQTTAFQLVQKNLIRAAEITGITTIVAAGGVIANNRLKNELQFLAGKKGLEILTPKKKILCTDNGAMVACLGYHLWKQGQSSGLDFRVSPTKVEIS